MKKILHRLKWGELRLGRIEGILALATIGTAIFLPERQPLFKLCPFNRTTGYPCPFCGLSRSFLALGHARLKSAAKYNLLGLPLFVLALVLPFKLTRQSKVRIVLTTRRVGLALVMIGIAWFIKLRYVSRAYW